MVLFLIETRAYKSSNSFVLNGISGYVHPLSRVLGYSLVSCRMRLRNKLSSSHYINESML